MPQHRAPLGDRHPGDLPLLAGQLSRLLRARIAARRRAEADQTAKAADTAEPAASALAARSRDLGRGSLERLAFPLLGLVFVTIGRSILSNFHHDNLLHLANSLLFAMAAIRVAVYLLRNVFAVSGALQAGERWLSFAVWLAVAADISGLTPGIVALLESVSFRVGKQSISLWQIGQGLFSVALTLLVSLWFSTLFEARLMRAESLDASFRVVLGRFARRSGGAGGMVSMDLVGIDLTVLSVFGGALGVGLGLGLQQMASNY